VNRTSTRTQNFALKYSFVVTDSLSDLKCRACKGFVETHQPNPNQPERILGTCSHCGVWYLIEATDNAGGIMVLELPDVSEIPHESITAPRA
jgi:hypothetical protein